MEEIFNSPWVQSPQIPSVQELVQTVTPVNYERGSGKAKQRLDLLEASYRNWIRDIVDLSDFKHCYFVNGVTDALNQWIATEERQWQYLKGDYEYAKMIGGKGECVNEIQPKKLLSSWSKGTIRSSAKNTCHFENSTLLLSTIPEASNFGNDPPDIATTKRPCFAIAFADASATNAPDSAPTLSFVSAT